LNDGDVLGLGGFEFVVVFESSAPAPQAAAPELTESPSLGAPVAVSPPPVGAPDLTPNVAVAESQPEAASNSSSMLLLLLIPVFGLILFLFAGGVLYLLLSEPTTTVAKKQDDSGDLYGDPDDTDTKNKTSKSNDNENKDSGTTTQTTSSNSSTDTPPGTNSANTAKLGETAKIEQNGGAFLRQIAQNNPRAFLTGDQAQQLSSKVKQLSGSSAVAENLKNAQKNASGLKSLAVSKNLKPQFLTIAAVAKLGSNRGDVLQTAQGMTDVLDKLTTHLGNELADDSLLVIAAYGQGAAGEFMRMRNMLQDLANKSPQSSREIRSIWFLQKNGKISQAEFENALTFLAIGTIAQNPKDFGVNAEGLSL